MILCPDCNREFAENDRLCGNCNWEIQYNQGYSNFLSTQDRESPLFSGYMDNYDSIASDDLNNSIQDPVYLNNQIQKLDYYIGDVRGKKVCEVGVGQGRLFERLAAKKPSKLVGIDISVPYFKAIKEKGLDGELLVANAENIPFQNEFDVIIASDIIEHVFNVGDFLFSVNRALKQNGVLVIRAPNDEDINIYSRFKNCPYDYVHLRNFSKKTLTTVLKGAGFKVERYYLDGYLLERPRRYIQFNKNVYNKFSQLMKMVFKTPANVSSINNFFGKLMMKPIEITAVTRKRKDICSD